ncbi:hypothetical protein D3C86_961900 [compost metagenome]
MRRANAADLRANAGRAVCFHRQTVRPILPWRHPPWRAPSSNWAARCIRIAPRAGLRRKAAVSAPLSPKKARSAPKPPSCPAGPGRRPFAASSAFVSRRPPSAPPFCPSRRVRRGCRMHCTPPPSQPRREKTAAILSPSAGWAASTRRRSRCGLPVNLFRCFSSAGEACGQAGWKVFAAATRR